MYPCKIIISAISKKALNKLNINIINICFIFALRIDLNKAFDLILLYSFPSHISYISFL